VLGWRADDGGNVAGVHPRIGILGGAARATGVPVYAVAGLDAALARVGDAGGTIAPTASLAAAVTRLWSPLPSGTAAGGPTPVPTQIEGELPWTNVGPAFEGALEGYGLQTQSWSGRPVWASLEPGQDLTLALPPVGQGGGLLRVLLRPNAQATAALTLHLYHRQGNNWQEVLAASPSDDGTPTRILELKDPAPGDYAVSVEAARTLGGQVVIGRVAFELLTEWLPPGGMVVPTARARRFGEAESGRLGLVVTPPPTEGVYLGGLRVIDRSGSSASAGGAGGTVSLLPLTVSRRGEPAYLTVAPGALVPGRNLVTFRAREEDGRALDRFSLELNGRLYQAVGGRLTVCLDVPAAPAGAGTRMQARLTAPDGADIVFVFFLPVVSQDETDLSANTFAPAWLTAEGYRPAALDAVRSQVVESLWREGTR